MNKNYCKDFEDLLNFVWDFTENSVKIGNKIKSKMEDKNRKVCGVINFLSKEIYDNLPSAEKRKFRVLTTLHNQMQWRSVDITGLNWYLYFCSMIHTVKKFIPANEMRELEKEVKEGFEAIKDFNRNFYQPLKLENKVLKVETKVMNRKNPIQELKEIAGEVKKEKGRYVWSEISRRAQKVFPNGINGRKLDDKYCKRLLGIK